MLSREAIEQRELEQLEPYAMKARLSRGRRHPEQEHPYRTAYQRDRDRIIHCSAFRRLEYKTQVFVNTFGDYYRTRLTHTMEVAQIARTIARALGLNEDLTEAVALAHDLGHGPFGHTGEDALRDMMAEHGGFEHNRHALRIVDVIECKYPEFPGLNLTEEVRHSLLKHAGEQLYLEAQVVDAADRIAYNTHDLDDGLTSGLLREEQLAALELWREASEAVRERWPDLDTPRRRYHTIRSMIDFAVTDVLSASRARLTGGQAPGDPSRARAIPHRLVAPSPEMERRQRELSAFLYETLYNQFQVRRMRNKADRFLREMFATLIADPGQLPPAAQAWVEDHGVPVGVCDYIAGMTDREALLEYRRLFHPDAGTHWA
jgi:dGTPase